MKYEFYFHCIAGDCVSAIAADRTNGKTGSGSKGVTMLIVFVDTSAHPEPIPALFKSPVKYSVNS